MNQKTAEQRIAALTASGNKAAEETLGDRGEPGVAVVNSDETDELREDFGGQEEAEGSEALPEGEADERSADSVRAEDQATPSTVAKDEYDKVLSEAIARRHANKELREQLERQTASIEEMRQLMLQQTAKPPSEEELAVAEDPAVRLIRQDIEQMRRDAGLTPEQMEARREQAAVQQQMEEVSRYVRAGRESFVKEHPDYQDAFVHARNARFKQLVKAGYEEGEAAQILSMEANDVCARAYRNRQNPAQVIYEMAQEIYGYKPRAAEAEEVQPANNGFKKPQRDMDAVARIKRGMRYQGMAGVGDAERGGPGASAQRGIMTRDQFFSQVDQGTRLEVLSRPEKFEELARDGSITVDW